MPACPFYMRGAVVPPNQEDIKTRLSTGDPCERAQAVRELVRVLVHDDRFPSMIMHVITNIIPLQSKSRELQKAMYLYWQVIDKYKADGTLKEEIFLACNSFRTDLLSHNEYVRGRVLRMVSRMMDKNIIQPLSNAITSNLSHKSAFVRRNAVVCLYHVQMHFGADIIGEIDEEIEKMLRKENDLSSKRNAFLLLEQSAPAKALAYIDTQTQSEEIGDILQVAILNVLRLSCKGTPSLKPRLNQLIREFQMKATESVLLQCAITLTSINHSATAIKHTLSLYCALIIKTNEINVKKAILDRLESVSRHSSYIGDDLLPDLINCLDSPSLQLKVKLLHIVMSALTLRSIPLLFTHMAHYLTQKHLQPQYLLKLMAFSQLVAAKFPQQSTQLYTILTTKLFKVPQFTEEAGILLNHTLHHLLKRTKAITLVDTLPTITSKYILRIVLNTLATELTSQDQLTHTLSHLIAHFSSLILDDCITGGVLIRTLYRLLRKIKDVAVYNAQAHPTLLLLCSLYRHYKQEQGVDQAVLDLLSYVIRSILDPDQSNSVPQSPPADPLLQEQGESSILKYPQDGVHFRLLDKDEAEEEMVCREEEEEEYINPLKTIVQLTGWKETVYAEARVSVRKCDVKLSVLLINNSSKPIQNVQVQFASEVGIVVLDKAQSIHLKPSEPGLVHIHLRFNEDAFGYIYGFINYDNLAGVEQTYIITQQISINYMDYFVPAAITLSLFDTLWEHTYKTCLTVQGKYDRSQSMESRVRELQKEVRGKVISSIDQREDYFMSCKMVTKSKLEGYILFILSLFCGEDDIVVTVNMKFGDKPHANTLYTHLVKQMKGI